MSELDKPWRGNREVDPSTIITISILSTIIILVLIVIIATVMVKQRKVALENARFDIEILILSNRSISRSQETLHLLDQSTALQ